MPINKLKGLGQLGGFSNLSKEEQDAFIEANEGLIASHSYSPEYIQSLYDNGKFVQKFGLDMFKSLPDAAMRDAYLENEVVKEELEKWGSPYNPDGTRNNSKGLGTDWEKVISMPISAQRKLLESDFLNPSEFEEKWKGYQGDIADVNEIIKNRNNLLIGNPAVPGSENPDYWIIDKDQEGTKELAKRKNQKILDNIYNDAVDDVANGLSSEVAAVHFGEEMQRLSDEQVKDWAKRAIQPNSYTDANGQPNPGIPEFAKYFVEDSDGGGFWRNFTVDDARKLLAMKKVYEENMDPEMAKTALDNYAKRYNTDHQSAWDKTMLLGKDICISAMSYSADKVNGIYNTGLWAADKLWDKPIVLVDDAGNVIDSNEQLTQGEDGVMYHMGEDGKAHAVHQEQIARTTLHNMGRNMDGSKSDEGWYHLNPQYWTKAEQFGTLDADLQNQYEKLGTSPYKVAYNPNEDDDLLYEAFKMASFGLADGAWQLIPYGLGRVGKLISTANKIGRVGRGLGEALDFAGKMTTAQTKIGQVAQGLAGAGGIAYAYQRGSFNETLQQNLANAEQTVLDKSRNEIYELYNNDEEYKKQIDALTDAKAASMKADYMAQLQSEGNNKIVDEDKLDEMLRAKAQEAVLGELVQQKVAEKKGSQEYADLQQEAINSAGDAAITTFFPEAVKYGLVNTVGFRSWLYKNPASLQQKAGQVFKGIKEVTTTEGKQRLATEASKFATRGDKLKQFGKVLGSQVWGGAWTNGTDDMMVDAAERINEDSFNRYLNAYATGESIADTYGFADGFYSYWKGLNNSLGQETTWNAAAVGGLGSVLSVTPNMTNIAHYMTKSGRQDFKERYKEGTWRDKANYFIQNGVLNTYYGAKINEQDQKNHVDYVNKLLDDYEDFKVVEDLITSDIGLQNAETVGDQKTMEFVKAIHAVNALNHLANDKNDPAAMSSVVNNMKSMIDRAAKMSFDPNEEGSLSEEEANNLVAQYYANNPGLAHSEYNSQKALYDIAQNAQELQEASKAYDEAEKQVQSVERSRGQQIALEVRAKMKMNQALNGHWQKRVDTMKNEIGDTSSSTEVSEDKLIPSLGGSKNAAYLIKVYNKQQKELEKELEEQQQETQKKKEALKKAQDDLKAAKTSDEQFTAQKIVKEAQAEVDDALQHEDYLKGLAQRTTDKKDKVEKALNIPNVEVEKALTANEIFSLDPITRARMMNPDNRSLYSEAQQREIEKLEQQLLMKDGEALQKIQDIALLTQRINTNQDAYSRMAKNPEAAAVQLEAQRQQSADAAYKLINQRNAETVADVISQFDQSVKGRDDVSQEQKEQFVFKTLRKLNPILLNIMDEDRLLPQYQKQVQDAKEWGEVTADIDAVINNSEKDENWKQNLSQNVANIVESATNKDEIMTNLEKVIDDVDNPQVAQDFESVLSGLEKLGYQRDATVIENRRQRKEREEANKSIKVDAEEAAKTAANEAAAQAAVEAEEWAAKAQKNPQGFRDVNLEDVPLEEEEQKNVFTQFKGKVKEAIEFLKQKKDGIAKAVLNHSELGDIDLVWGDQRMGLSHILDKHPAVADNLQDVIGSMKVVSKSENRAVLESDTHKAVVSNNWYGQKADNWLLTAYEKKKGASGESIDINPEPNEGKQNGTAPLQDTVSEGKDSQNIRNNQENSEKNDNFAEQLSSRVVDNGDAVQGKSPTIEEQMADSDEITLKEQYTSETTTDVAAINAIGEHVIDNSVTTLSGNAMAEYLSEPLQNDGILKHKQGKDPSDRMNKFYAWMDAAGIKLQNIIDMELGRILARNSQAKVKFMAIRPESNATHDGDMKTHLMLVLDYDNSINKGITQIHNDSNGGVIESAGKKYLIVGVVGWGRSAEKKALKDILFNTNPALPVPYGLVKKGMGEFFRNNPSERFFVQEDLSTEVVPASLIPGYRIKQLETDTNAEYRSIHDILSDSQRNPMGLDMESLSWGIQERTKFLVVGTSLDKVMVPRNVDKNAGSAFVLIPAANGKMVPAYLRPLMWNEINNGKLKDRINGLLMDLTAPQYATRYNALMSLQNIFYMDLENGDHVLLGKDNTPRRNQVSLIHDGKVFRTFVLDSNFDRQQFMEAIAEMNPRINITASVLQSPLLLQQYDEAGALQTDIARFGTAGSTYSIYAVDADGKILKPEAVPNDVPKSPVGADFRSNPNKVQVVYRGNYYLYDSQIGAYYLNGEMVRDAATLKNLFYNRKIVESGLVPVQSKGPWSYYILGTEAVKVNSNTKEVEVLSEAQAQELKDKVAKEKAEKEREIAAEKELNAAEAKLKNVEDVDLLVDPETGELIASEQNTVSEEKREIGEKEKKEEEEEAPAEQQRHNQDNLIHRSVESLEGSNASAATQNFETLVSNRKYMMQILKVIKGKWPSTPNKIAELKQFLKGKNMEVDAIGTSDADIQAWIKTLKDCR